jgi:hypothetical protein
MKMCLRVSYKKKCEEKISFLHPWSHWREESDPDPLVRGMNPRIRIWIRTKMSRIPNTASKYSRRMTKRTRNASCRHPDAQSDTRCPAGHKMPQEMPGVAAGGLVGARLARLLHREEAPLVAATRPDLRTSEGTVHHSTMEGGGEDGNQGVTRRCLSWLTNSALVYEPKFGGRGLSLDSYCCVTSFWLFIFENYVHVPSKSNKQKNVKKFFFFFGFLERSMTKIAGSGSACRSGSISQWHGSADPDPDPDPPQNVMDPQHCNIQMGDRTVKKSNTFSVKKELNT